MIETMERDDAAQRQDTESFCQNSWILHKLEQFRDFSKLIWLEVKPRKQKKISFSNFIIHLSDELRRMT